MKSKLFVLIAACVLVLMMSTTALAASRRTSASSIITSDTPGVINTTFKINVVFVGYKPADINMPNFQQELPSTYDPLVRDPHTYFGIDLPVNIHGDYSYNYVFAPDSFNDAFFANLAATGTRGIRTDFQKLYNQQVHKSLTIPRQVLYVDAPSTELWLMEQGRKQLGLDVANYTIFFVNWYGRGDFQYHVYTKTDDPDPDTHYNFGVERASRKMIAWGGTYGRTWFYDLSAGPEAWSYNYDVDNADVDGDGKPDYRMPPVWEYGNVSGYRPFDNLSGDLGKVLRYVAIDELFTSSPLYDPLVSEPFPGKGKRMLINMFEDDPSTHGPDWVKLDYVAKTMRHFEPQYKWNVTLKDQPLKDSGIQRPFRIWAGLNPSNDCWNQFGTVFAELFCFVDNNRTKFLPPIKPHGNYVGGLFAFNTTDNNLGANTGLLGYADDDWTSGTPSYVFAFETQGARDAGFGFSTTFTHEFGHHIGMSHPHDGYDSQSNTDFGPSGDFYYAWSGDESHTIMQYIALANQFGWFDRDNMNRFLAGRYLTRASEIAGRLSSGEMPGSASALLNEANTHLADARSAFQKMDYETSAAQARAGFERVWRAAQAAGLNVPMVNPLPAGVLRHDIPKQVDPIRFPNN